MNKDRFYQILWALPIIFSIHNVEELPQLGSWANEQVTLSHFIKVDHGIDDPIH